MKKFLLILLVAIIFPTFVFAQVERLPGVVDKNAPDVDVEIKKPGVAIEGASSVVLPKDAGVTVGSFSSVKFSGVKTLAESKLQGIASSYLGRTINKGDVATLKHELTQAFYNDGYKLVKIVISSKKTSSKVLSVSVHEAEIGNLNVQDGDNVLNSAIVSAFTSRLSGGEVFNEDDAESIITDIDDLKNIAATINLQPGKKFKTTDLSLTINEADENDNFISVDNYGSELTGRKVATAHLEHSNLLHLGETYTADFSKSEDDFWSAGLGVVTPIGYRNVKLEVNGLLSENDIGNRLASLDAKGETSMYDIALSSNLLNKRDQKITVRGGFESRTHESFLAGAADTKDKIRSLFFDTSYLQREDRGVFFASARISKGIDVLNASKEGDASATRATGDPEALIFQPYLLANFQPDMIPGVPFVDGDIKVIVSGQLASGTLLSSDLFVVGGQGSVRGFEVAQETGEAGYQFTVEYNHNLDLQEDWAVKAGPFVDGATVYNRIDGSTEDDHIYSVGLGLEATTSIVPSGDTRFRFDIAHPLGAYQSQEVDDNYAYFSVTQSF